MKPLILTVLQIASLISLQRIQNSEAKIPVRRDPDIKRTTVSRKFNFNDIKLWNINLTRSIIREYKGIFMSLIGFSFIGIPAT